jgi:uncharacterized protein YcnI
MKTPVLTVFVFLMSSFAAAHVSVRPRESRPGVEERYTVRVPTEGSVPTTRVVLDIPTDVTVLDVPPAEGARFETAKQDERVISIAWTKEIAPKSSAEFVFPARNPAATEIVWKAHQHFSDGTVADWVGVAGERRPASVTKLVATSAAVGAQSAGDAAAVEQWLRGYDAAFNAKDLDKLATFYHPDVTIFEGGGMNNGWIDYWDRHLGPELKSFENLEFGHSSTKVTILPGGQAAAEGRRRAHCEGGKRRVPGHTLTFTKAVQHWRVTFGGVLSPDVTQVAGTGGSAPSCCMREKRFATPQCSAIAHRQTP